MFAAGSVDAPRWAASSCLSIGADHQDEAVVAGDGGGRVGRHGSSPSRATVLDGVSGSAWAAISHATIVSSWARTAVVAELDEPVLIATTAPR